MNIAALSVGVSSLFSGYYLRRESLGLYTWEIKPVIAVPTSVGYGSAFGGITALLGMLNSCAPGVAVVNIDNGFGAGCMAATINRKND